MLDLSHGTDSCRFDSQMTAQSPTLQSVMKVFRTGPEFWIQASNVAGFDDRSNDHSDIWETREPLVHPSLDTKWFSMDRVPTGSEKCEMGLIVKSQ